jgi:flavin-dependent dehydrogenase
MNRYDAIVVGARCAGSPTAMLLACKGHRVLLVDRAIFPSDTLSTHVIHAPGVAALRRWRLLDEVTATGCPPLGRYSFNFGPVVVAGTPHPWDGCCTAYAPRRTILDRILLDAAARAGAEVRQGYTVDEVLTDDGVVVGVRGHGSGKAATVDRARVVIGADGWNSVVARAVRAPQYHEKPVLENAFYTYWSGLPTNGFETYIRPERGFAAIPTNDDLTLVLVGCPYREASTFRRDLEANYFAAFELEPGFANRIHGATREERFRGGGVPNFFRKPYGPGWALVGDAGYTKDPVTAQGITDAFQTAEQCAAALDASLRNQRPFHEAMAEYQQARDQHMVPIYEFTTQLATLEPPSPEMQQLLAGMPGDQAAMDAFVSVTAGTLTPGEFFASVSNSV